jgi:hypothetical protein
MDQFFIINCLISHPINARESLLRKNKNIPGTTYITYISYISSLWSLSIICAEAAGPASVRLFS